MEEVIHLGKWTEEKLTDLIHEASKIDSPGERSASISRHFLATKYKESTLIGDAHTPEVFVINLAEVDCFTLIEYCEAMRRSSSFHDFKESLRKVRYRSGEISFQKRNHFFTDWRAFNSDRVVDVTRQIGRGKSKDVSKRLNEKSNGTTYLPGIACRLREITYVQSIHIDDAIIDNLNTGDYIGIYAKYDGLDVSHVGIFVRDKGSIRFRHASSVKKHRRVIDEDFKEYLKAKPGIIVFRPRD